MIRPRKSASDTPEDAREKNFIRSRCSLLRDPTDALECRLALMGYDSRHYVLTFDDEHLPPDYAGAFKAWQAFHKRCRRALGKAFDFVKCIEGLHGDHRWHIHLVCRGEDFTTEQIRQLWGLGYVYIYDVITDVSAFRRLARYFRKERRDGQRLPLDKQPLSWSASLTLPEPERWKEKSGKISAPAGAATVLSPSFYQNSFGGFCFMSYLININRAPARVRARVRAR